MNIIGTMMKEREIMDKPILFIITHMFPYQPPMEQYLSDEINTIKKYFDEIYIIPSSRHLNMYDANYLDDDIKVIKVTRRSKFVEFTLSFFKNILFNRKFYKELYFLFNKRLITNKIAFKNLFLVFIYSDSVSSIISKKIKELDINPDKNIVIYSYWLSHYASIAANTKLKLSNIGYTNVKCISRAHGSSDLFVSKQMKGHKIDLKTINKYIDRVYSISEAGANYLNSIGINNSIIKVNRLGVKEQENTDYSQSQSKTFEIVSCSNVVEVKRVHLILDALRLIHDYNIRWTHFGDGPLLKELIECSKFDQKNIDILLYGKKSNDFIMDYYKKEKPNLFINVSAVEGIPVSIMEAISYGIPVIATDVGGTREVCIDKYNGVLLEKDFQIDELSSEIIKFFNMSLIEYSKFRLNAFKLYQDRFNSRTNYEKFGMDIVMLAKGENKVE